MTIAIDYPLSVSFLPKNAKLPTVTQCHFLNGRNKTPFGLADAREEEQAVTHY